MSKKKGRALPDSTNPIVTERPERTVLDEKLIKNLEEAIFLGIDISTACAKYGYSERTVAHWINQGRKLEKGDLCDELVERLKKARANSEIDALMAIKTIHMRGKPAEYKQVLKKKRTLPDGSIEEIYDQVKVSDEIKPDLKAAQWYLSKMFKKKYGDHLTLALEDGFMGKEEPQDITPPKDFEERKLLLLNQIKQMENLDDDSE